MTVTTADYRAHATKIRNGQVIRLVIFFWLVCCLFLAVLNQDVLPAKYFFDSGNISSRFSFVHGLTLNDSYNNTALFYELLLLSGSQHFTAFLTDAIFTTFVIKCFSMPEKMDWRAIHNIALCAFSALVGSVYLAQYSKEAIVMLIVFLFFGLSKGRAQQLIWIAIVCFYSTYFRTYWFLVLMLYVYYAIVFKISRNIFMIFLSIIIAFLLLAIAFKAVLGVDLAYYRYAVNDARIYNTNANTLISPLLPTGNVALEWLNAVLQFFLMFFPFPLLTGNPVYLMFFLVVASIGIRIFGILRSLLNANKLKVPSRESRSLALILAFVTIQSIFEPDYGSYIKHLTPMLPLILYIFCWHQCWRLISGERDEVLPHGTMPQQI